MAQIFMLHGHILISSHSITSLLPEQWTRFIREMILLCYYASASVGWLSNKYENFRLEKKRKLLKLQWLKESKWVMEEFEYGVFE